MSSDPVEPKTHGPEWGVSVVGDELEGAVMTALEALAEAGLTPAQADEFVRDSVFNAWMQSEAFGETLVCICPPELLARGGFKGGCPIHG